MSQHKRKPKQQQNLKVLAAQYRKNFFQKFKLIIDSTCGHHIYHLIPQFVLDDAYLCRCAPFKFRAEQNSIITPKHLEDSKVILSSIFKKQTIQLPPHNLEITLSEYYTVYLTIIVMNSRISDTTFINANIVKEALQFFTNDTATLEAANKQMYGILYTYNLGECDLKKMLYWYKHEHIVPKTFPAETENMVTIGSFTSENIMVEVDGINRPAIRVGWAFAYVGAEWLSLKPSDLGFKSPFAEIPLKVYIQSHAINRLLERIDCFWSGNIQFNMYCSLAKPIIAHDTNNNLLIEFRFFDTKAGYFRADIVEGIILIRTFLFITNNGTPEGHLLEKNTGLQKLDKKYLAIDKLSTFMTSDIASNPNVCRIFNEAGCHCLIDLYERMKPLVTKQSNQFDANLMLNYLNYNTTTTLEPSTNEALLESANNTL